MYVRLPLLCGLSGVPWRTVCLVFFVHLPRPLHGLLPSLDHALHTRIACIVELSSHLEAEKEKQAEEIP